MKLMRTDYVGSKKALLAAAMATVLAGCMTPKPPPKTVEVPPAIAQAVNTCVSLVPISASSTAGGLAEQSRWIAARYPGAVKIRQSVVQCGNTPVDVVSFRAGGVDRTVLFDISNFFGRVGTDNLDDLLDG